MTRPNAGTRQLAINLPTVEYERLMEAAGRKGLSMTLATRMAVNTWTARQLGRYVPPAAPKDCPGSGASWGTVGQTSICPACALPWRQLGLTLRPNRKTTTVPSHGLGVRS